MNGELDNAKVGDRLFVSNGLAEGIEVVERLTQTLVITKYHRFKKQSGKGQGDERWCALYARLATDEDVAMINRMRMIRKCENIDFQLLPNSQLEQILEIVNPKTKEE